MTSVRFGHNWVVCEFPYEDDLFTSNFSTFLYGVIEKFGLS